MKKHLILVLPLLLCTKIYAADHDFVIVNGSNNVQISHANEIDENKIRTLVPSVPDMKELLARQRPVSCQPWALEGKLKECEAEFAKEVKHYNGGYMQLTIDSLLEGINNGSPGKAILAGKLLSRIIDSGVVIIKTN